LQIFPAIYIINENNLLILKNIFYFLSFIYLPIIALTAYLENTLERLGASAVKPPITIPTDAKLANPHKA
jgi:hypothetical protein